LYSVTDKAYSSGFLQTWIFLNIKLLESLQEPPHLKEKLNQAEAEGVRAGVVSEKSVRRREAGFVGPAKRGIGTP
jgi:hypothetical protein